MNYKTCLLAPDFQVAEINLHPGQSFPDRAPSIRLAGGFSATFPDTEFTLSPTLQLNHDIGTWSERDLEAIALAELKRASEMVYKSYLTTADYHVCVIANSSEKLEKFIDDYGGVLEIDPVLLKEEHPDYDQVTDLAIGVDGQKYKVVLTTRSPINFEKCTYCGNCGPACPEKCISPALTINYGTCTFCKECEKVCLEGAVDVYGVVKKEIMAPTVILLDQVSCELPGQREKIYSSENMPDYFNTICSVQVDEVVGCDHSTCQYSLKLKAGCGKCLASCKVGAVSITAKGIEVDSLKCDECGSCISTCPTGAMQYKRFSDASFFDYFKGINVPKGTAVVVGSESVLQEFWWKNKGVTKKNIFFLEHPCVDSLASHHFLFLLTKGASGVFLLKGENETSSVELKGEIDNTATLLKTLYDLEGQVAVCTPFDILSYVDQPLGLSFDTSDYQCQDVSGKRYLLAATLQYLIDKSGKDGAELGSHLEGFGQVVCDEGACTHCFACLNECKIKALSASEDKNSLQFLSAYCVGCGVCATICPENALTVNQGAIVDGSFFKNKELSRSEPVSCKECGKEFGTRKGFEKVMAILKSRDLMHKGHFEYCDDCRVKKIFETGESV